MGHNWLNATTIPYSLIRMVAISPGKSGDDYHTAKFSQLPVINKTINKIVCWLSSMTNIGNN